MHGESILFDIGVAILAATVLAYVARALRQPLLLAYIGAGLVIGPPGLGIVRDEKTIAELSELGLAFLMFIVGLEIDLKKLVSSGRIGAPVAINAGPNKGRKVVYVRDWDGVTLEFIETARQ